MVIELRQRTPLGAVYRTPLGVFGSGVAAPPDGQLSTSAPVDNATLVHRITSGCSGGNVTPGGALAPGTIAQQLTIPAELQSRPVADWVNATYVGTNGVTYTPSAITSDSCILPPTPPFTENHEHRYKGLLNVDLGGGDFAYDVVFVVDERQDLDSRFFLFWHWNYGEWPGSYDGTFAHPSTVDVYFN